jgi:SAM-dependent methyltransferase
MRRLGKRDYNESINTSFYLFLYDDYRMIKILKKLILKIFYPLFKQGILKVLKGDEAHNVLANGINIKKKYYNSLKYINDSFSAYHHDIILELHKKYSLSDKVVLDVGGSNIPSALMRDLGVKQLVCIDPVTKYLEFHNCSPVSQYHGKKIYSKNDISLSLPKDYSYIIDTDIEDANDIFKEYFDIIISISVFEHLTNIRESLRIIHKFLRVGGILHSQYEPIFTCRMGHHLYIDKNINFNNLNLCYFDNIHLLFTKDEAREFLKQYYNEDVINTSLYQIYDSNAINRKTFNEHILEIMNSPFNNYSIDYIFREPIDSSILQNFIDKIGFMRFDVRGLRLRCVKD